MSLLAPSGFALQIQRRLEEALASISSVTLMTTLHSFLEAFVIFSATSQGFSGGRQTQRRCSKTQTKMGM